MSLERVPWMMNPYNREWYLRLSRYSTRSSRTSQFFLRTSFWLPTLGMTSCRRECPTPWKKSKALCGGRVSLRRSIAANGVDGFLGGCEAESVTLNHLIERIGLNFIHALALLRGAHLSSAHH